MSFPKRQPELFDTKKLYGKINQGSGSNLAAAGLAMMADKPLAPDEIDSVPESWVELAPGRASLCSSIEAVNLDSNGDVSVNKDSRLSPVSLQSPHVEFVESSLEQVKYRLVKDMLPEAAKSTDWLWDWKNRSEAGVAPENPTTRNRSGGQQFGSALTTPPNSPEPGTGSSDFDFKSATASKIPRKESSKSTFFNWSTFCRLDVLLALVLTNLVTGAVVYYYLRMQKNNDPFEQTIITKYYW